MFKELLPLLIALIAGCICYGLFFNRNIWPSVIGYSVAPAERVMQGEVPYRDFLYNYTPGMLWLNAIMMKLLGATIWTVRVGLFAFKLASFAVMFYIGRRLVGKWAALIPIALTLGWLGYKYIFGVFPTQYSMLFILLGLLFMMKYDETEKRYWMALSGLAVGTVFIFKYNVGIVLFAFVTAAIFIKEAMLSEVMTGWSRLLIAALKRCVFFWAGFALAACAMAAYLAYNNALWAMIDHFIHHATAYGGERGVPLPSIKWLAPVLVGSIVVAIMGGVVLIKASRLFEAYSAVVFALGSIALFIPGRAYLLKVSASAMMAYLPLILFAIALGVALWQLKNIYTDSEQKKMWWQRNGDIVLLAIFAAGAFLEMYPRADFYHLVRVLPPVFLLLTVLIHRAMPEIKIYFQKYSPSPDRATMFCVVVPLVLLIIVGIKDVWQPHFDSRFGFIDRVPLTIGRANGILVRPKQAELIDGLSRIIENNSSTEDYIFSFAQRGTGLYFLTGRRNPTRFVWWRSVGLKKEDRENVMAMIADRRPKLILLQDGLKDKRVRDHIIASYHKIGAINDIAVYDRIMTIESRLY